MTLERDPISRIYSANIKDEQIDRLHVSLRTKRKDEAIRRHAAVEALVRQAPAYQDLIDGLRRRKLKVEAVTACYEAQKSFDALRPRHAWPTLGDAAERYKAWIRAHPKRKASTYRQVSAKLNGAIEALGALTRLDAITADDVQTWRQELAQTLKPATVAQYLIRLHALYTFVRQDEKAKAERERRAPHVLPVPVSLELLPDTTPERVRFLDRDEVARLFAATPEPLQFGVAAGALAGLRLEEMLHLRPRLDVDVRMRQFVIQARDGWSPKNRKNRVVPISAQLWAIVERHLEAYASDAWLMPSPARRGHKMSDAGFTNEFRRIVTNAELVYGKEDPQGVTYHTLRHTFASWAVMAGVDLFTVAKLLGDSVQMVEDVYGHLAPEHQQWAVDAVAGELAGQPVQKVTPAGTQTPDRCNDTRLELEAVLSDAAD